MMNRESDGRPALTRLVNDALQRTLGERFIGFVDQVQDATSLVVIAHEAHECRDGSCCRGVHMSDERRQIELSGRDRRAVEGHKLIVIRDEIRPRQAPKRGKGGNTERRKDGKQEDVSASPGAGREAAGALEATQFRAFPSSADFPRSIVSDVQTMLELAKLRLSASIGDGQRNDDADDE